VQVLVSVVDVLRDQIAAQQDTASTNELSSNGLMAASLAMVVALMILRATQPCKIGYWWWYPLPLFVVAGALLSVPAFPRRNRPRLTDGPKVPAFLAATSSSPHTQEQIFVRLIQDLQASWAMNDAILKTERACVRYGLYILAIASLVAVGVYSWGLN
jgi:hypothetical protein